MYVMAQNFPDPVDIFKSEIEHHYKRQRTSDNGRDNRESVPFANFLFWVHRLFP
jgi:hypothetical protein